MTLPKVNSAAQYAEVLSDDQGIYDLFTITAPRLTGLLLKVFVWIAESWICAPIRAKLLRDNRFPQTLKETVYPEAPTMSPVLSGFANGTVEVDNIQSDSATTRANKAASLASGTTQARRIQLDQVCPTGSLLCSCLSDVQAGR